MPQGNTSFSRLTAVFAGIEGLARDCLPSEVCAGALATSLGKRLGPTFVRATASTSGAFLPRLDILSGLLRCSELLSYRGRPRQHPLVDVHASPRERLEK